jgi:hypothetical protein
VVLPAVAVAVAALAEHLEEFAAPEPDGLVFPSGRGTYLQRSNFSRLVWRPAVKQLGLERQEGGRRLTCWFGWSGRRESNPHRELGKLEFCH